MVVLKFRAKRSGEVVSNFVTCYHADNSIAKIRTSPEWSLAACRSALGCRVVADLLRWLSDQNLDWFKADRQRTLEPI